MCGQKGNFELSDWLAKFPAHETDLRHAEELSPREVHWQTSHRGILWVCRNAVQNPLIKTKNALLWVKWCREQSQWAVKMSHMVTWVILQSALNKQTSGHKSNTKRDFLVRFLWLWQGLGCFPTKRRVSELKLYLHRISLP